MPSSKEYLDFIIEQAPYLSYIKMMGEYVLYYENKIIGGIYDDRFLIKDVPIARAFIGNFELCKPYEGGKPMLLVDNVDDREYIKELVEKIYPFLPFRKVKLK